MEKKYKILLTGSNGNLGYAIKNELKKESYNSKYSIKKDLNFNIFKANDWLNIKNTNFNQRDVLFYKKQ